MNTADAQGPQHNNDTFMMSERQPRSEISFDAFCENLCKGCRKVRWLGKPNPPREEDESYWNFAYDRYTISPQCSLCQQLLTLLPNDQPGGAINTSLTNISGEVEEMDFQYDVFRLGYVRAGRSFSFNFYMLHPQPEALLSSPFRSMRQQPNTKTRWAELRLLSESVNYSTIRACLNYCKRHHQDSCTSLQDIKVPGFRVLDCLNRTIVVATEHGIEYAALSYVWGTGFDQLTSAQNFPRTIEDGMRVTLSLGLRYLWVDRYCINQSNAAEKHTQISLMNHIYAQAQFTIVAASGDAQTGLPGVSYSGRRVHKFLDLGNVRLASRPPHSGESYAEQAWRFTWNKRAWTFQEGCLSRRLVVFTEEEVQFCCVQVACFESMAQMPPSSVADQNLRTFVPSVYKKPVGGKCGPDVHEMLEWYSNRTLTFDEDAVNACLGVLGALDTTHFWGVPIQQQSGDNCEMSLCWMNEEPGKQRSEFPSWSWARWTGQKHFFEPAIAPSILVDIRLNSGEWVNITRTDILKGNICDVSSGKTLRLTGTLLSPQFVSDGGSCSAVIQTKGGIKLRLMLTLDSEETRLEDLQDAVLIIYEDLHKRKDWYSNLYGWGLVLKPFKNFCIRLGLAGGHGGISSPDERALEFGVLKLAHATQQTIYLE